MTCRVAGAASASGQRTTSPNRLKTQWFTADENESRADGLPRPVATGSVLGTVNTPMSLIFTQNCNVKARFFGKRVAAIGDRSCRDHTRHNRLHTAHPLAIGPIARNWAHRSVQRCLESARSDLMCW